VQLTCRTLHRMHLETNPQESNPPLCFIEDPTYFLIPPIFQQSGYELEAIHTNQKLGLDLDDFEKKARAARGADPTRLLVLYSIPVHHNPLGVSLNEESRKKLIQVCESLKVYFIADEVYHGLSFPDTPFFAPMAMYQSKFVISCSAFTKILCPGIRCGWIQSCDLELLRRIGQDGVLDSGGCSSQMTSGIVAELILSGTMTSYMQSLQAEYAKRCHHLCQELHESSTADYQFEFEIPRGGYFLWVRVVGVNFVLDESFRLFCQKEYHVDFKTGTTCSSARGVAGRNPLGNCIRLCFAYYDTESLTNGVKRLCQAIENYPTANPSSNL
jgi:2-aminoadipate transaminase